MITKSILSNILNKIVYDCVWQACSTKAFDKIKYSDFFKKWFILD